MSDLNLDEFLTKDLGLPADLLGAVKEAIGDAGAQKLKEGVLRQSDYDRKMNAMKTDLQKQQEELQADIEAKQAEIVAEKQRLGQWKTDAEKRLADARLKQLQAEQRALKASELYGIDLDSIEVPELKELAKKAEAADPPDPKAAKKAIGEEDIYKLIEGGLDIQAEIEDIADEWRELNPGKRFPRKEFLETARKNARKGVTLRQTAEQLYEFSTTRSTQAQKKFEQEAEARLRQEFEEKLTQELSKRGIEAPRHEESPRSTFWRDRDEKAQRGRSQDDRVRAAQAKLGERAKA